MQVRNDKIFKYKMRAQEKVQYPLYNIFNSMHMIQYLKINKCNCHELICGCDMG